MIKKNTKVVIEGETGVEELVGGMPLSVGETVRIHPDGGEEVVEYEVVEKTVDCFMTDGDQRVDVVYCLRKR